MSADYIYKKKDGTTISCYGKAKEVLDGNLGMIIKFDYSSNWGLLDVTKSKKLKETNPNKPKLAIRMARVVIILKTVENLSSAWYWLLYRSSMKKYEKTLPGKAFWYASLTNATSSFMSLPETFTLYLFD